MERTPKDLKFKRAKSEQIAQTSFIDYDYLIKVAVVGDTGVGKSQLVARFTRNDFTLKSRQTIGVEFATKTVHVDGKQICCQLWDTAGEERYRALASAYYRGAVGVLLVFDVSKPRSFRNAAFWLSEIKAYSSADCQTMLIGNKIDLKDRKVQSSTARQFADKNRLDYIETSALQSTNVQAAFVALIEQIYSRTISKSSGSNLAYGSTQQGELKINRGADVTGETNIQQKIKQCCS